MVSPSTTLLWRMMDFARGQLDTKDSLDVITTIACLASMSPEKFEKAKNMGSSSIRPALDEMLKDAEKSSDVAFNAIVKLDSLSDDALASLVYSLAGAQNLSCLSESIREAFSEHIGRDSGIYTSSQYVKTLVSSLVGETSDKLLLDASCGLARTSSSIRTQHSVYQDLSPKIVSLATRLLLIEGAQSEVLIGDSLLQTEQFNGPFDLVVMEPPMGLRLSREYLKKVEKQTYLIDVNKSIPASAGDALWIQMALGQLNETGKAFLLLPQGVLFRGGYDAAIRDYLLDNELIDQVIVMPSRVLNHTGIPPALLVLNKQKEKGSPIRMVDLSEIGTASRTVVSLSEKGLEAALKLISSDETSSQAVSVSIRQIRMSEVNGKGNNLNISSYLENSVEIELPSLEQALVDYQNAKVEFELAQADFLKVLER